MVRVPPCPFEISWFVWRLVRIGPSFWLTSSFVSDEAMPPSRMGPLASLLAAASWVRDGVSSFVRRWKLKVGFRQFGTARKFGASSSQAGKFGSSRKRGRQLQLANQTSVL